MQGDCFTAGRRRAQAPGRPMWSHTYALAWVVTSPAGDRNVTLAEPYRHPATVPLARKTAARPVAAALAFRQGAVALTRDPVRPSTNVSTPESGLLRGQIASASG